jgi:hypothetical protein
MLYILIADDLGIFLQDLNIYKNLQENSLIIIMAKNKTTKKKSPISFSRQKSLQRTTNK